MKNVSQTITLRRNLKKQQKTGEKFEDENFKHKHKEPFLPQVTEGKRNQRSFDLSCRLFIKFITLMHDFQEKLISLLLLCTLILEKF